MSAFLSSWLGLALMATIWILGLAATVWALCITAKWGDRNRP